MRRALLLIGLLWLTAAPSAEVYRWVGADGNAQFGDTPPPGARDVEALAIDLDQRINPDADHARRLERQQAIAEELERARLERARVRAQALADARRAAELCARYRERVRLLADTGVRWIKGRDGGGRDTYYSDAEVARMRQEAARGVRSYCR